MTTGRRVDAEVKILRLQAINADLLAALQRAATNLEYWSVQIQEAIGWIERHYEDAGNEERAIAYQNCLRLLDKIVTHRPSEQPAGEACAAIAKAKKEDTTTPASAPAARPGAEHERRREKGDMTQADPHIVRLVELERINADLLAALEWAMSRLTPRLGADDTFPFKQALATIAQTKKKLTTERSPDR